MTNLLLLLVMLLLLLLRDRRRHRRRLPCVASCLSLLQGVGSLAVLPEVVEAVSGRAKVIVDGGFCRGTDIVKAIALGADGVALGRLTGLALAGGGEPALIRALDLLAEELWSAVGLLGCTSLSLLTPKHLSEVTHLGDPPHVFSAFPHLDRSIAEHQSGQQAKL